MKCNTFENNDIAVYSGPYSDLTMNTDFGAGYNVFENNTIHIELYHANDVKLRNGFNTFGAFTEFCMTGLVNGDCDNGIDCSGPFEISAAQNNWGEFTDPFDDMFHVEVSANFDPCTHGCPVLIHDYNPVETTECGFYDQDLATFKPYKPGHKSMVSSLKTGTSDVITSDFGLVPLNIAIQYAGQLFQNDQESCLHFLNDIFINNPGLDSDENDYWVKEGLELMKCSLEELQRKEISTPENQILNFDPYSQLYIEAVNSFAKISFDRTEYLNQFNLEMDKIQFFLSLEDFDSSIEILDRINDCGINSMEYNHLDRWREFLLDQLGEEGYINIIQDDIVLDEFSFGCRILERYDFHFPDCDSLINKSNRTMSSNEIRISPNPNHGRFFCSATNPGLYHFNLYSTKGQLLEFKTVEINGDGHEFDLTRYPPGLYFIELYNKTFNFSQRIIIQ